MQFLADDRLEGRDTGSRGLDLAADYMAEQFQRGGLEPAGTDGYRQRMEFEVSRLDESRSSLALVHNGTVQPLKLGEDAVLVVSSRATDRLEADAVFVGYGLVVPERNYDDLAGLDLAGKVVVYFTGGPPDMPSAIKAHYQSADERRRALRKAGVVGSIAIPNPKSIERPWSRVAASRFEPKMELVDPGYDAPPPLPLAVMFNTDRAGRLFTHSGHSVEALFTAIQEGKPLPRFPLGVRVRATLGMQRSRVTSQNVAAVLPGTDPTLRGEYVAVTAHLDHVGVGEPVNGDRIYSGALDNAAGAASLIEVARAVRESRTKPRRSVLFLAVTGEEKGLLGSQYYATHPTKGPIVADLNMDMYNPLFALRYLEIQGLEESSLGEDVRAVAHRAGVELQPDQEPEHNRFIRSDQYSFIKTGVPAVTFKFSYLPGTPEEGVFNRWLAERYHAPLDDLEQPVDRAAAARFNALLADLTLRVANADTRPEWRPDSFFRRFVR